MISGWASAAYVQGRFATSHFVFGQGDHALVREIPTGNPRGTDEGDDLWIRAHHRRERAPPAGVPLRRERGDGPLVEDE